jgi:hypothetical protein
MPSVRPHHAPEPPLLPPQVRVSGRTARAQKAQPKFASGRVVLSSSLGALGLIGSVGVFVILEGGVLFPASDSSKSSSGSQMVVASANSSKAAPLVSGLQNSLQESFEQILALAALEYQRAENEIKKSRIYRESQTAASRLIQAESAGYRTWTGVIKSISTNKGGSKINIKISSAHKVGPGHRRPFWVSYINHKDIEGGSILALQLEKLEEGQTVEFRFAFVPDDDFGLLKSELFEYSAVEYPCYRVNFESVTRKF